MQMCRLFGAGISANADISAHNAKLLHPRLKGASLHSKHRRSAAGASDNPVGSVESVKNMAALGVVHGQDGGRSVRTGFVQVVFGDGEALAGGEDDGAFDDVPQLAD